MFQYCCWSLTFICAFSYFCAGIPKRYLCYDSRKMTTPSTAIHVDIYALTSVVEGRTFVLTPNICNISPENLRDVIFPNEKYGLNNRTLKVSAMWSPGMMNTRQGYTGYLREILDEMARRLNFSFVIGLPPDMRWGDNKTGVWNGMIGQLVRREIDLVVATVTIHQGREAVMDFLLPPTFTEVFDIIYRLHGETGEEWKIYFRPFQSIVFVTLLATLVTFSFLVAILHYNENEVLNVEKRKTRNKHLIFDAWFYVFGLFITRSVSLKARTWVMNLLGLSWALFSFVVAAHFCANLTAFFTVKKDTLPFTSLAELVKQNDYKFGMESGDVREVIFRETKTGDRKDAWDKIVKMNQTDPEVLDRELEVHTRKMFTEKYAYFTSRRFGSEHVSKDCRVRLVGDQVMWHQYGIGVPQIYPLKNDMESILFRMSDMGLFDYWYKKWKIHHKNLCVADQKVPMLVLTDVQTAFYVLCVGFVTAGGILLIEKSIKGFRI